MRVLCFAVILLNAVSAQDTSSYKTATVDINGNRVVQGPEVTTTNSGGGSATTERMRSVNGRMVPVEREEERVVRDDASGKIVERIVHRYDGNGNAIGSEKVVVEEHKGLNGSSTILTTNYAADVNGHMKVMERSTTEVQIAGETRTSDTVVERPTANDSLQAVEKQTKVVVKQRTGYEEAAITYRRGPNGDFYAAARRVTDHTETLTQHTDNTSEYEVGSTGKLELHGQTVTRAQKRSDGSEDVQVDILSRNVPGVVNDTHALQLQEHQIIERRTEPGRGIVETLSVQRPTVSDANRLERPKVISETVCRGKCDSSR